MICIVKSALEINLMDVFILFLMMSHLELINHQHTECVFHNAVSDEPDGLFLIHTHVTAVDYTLNIKKCVEKQIRYC